MGGWTSSVTAGWTTKNALLPLDAVKCAKNGNELSVKREPKFKRTSLQRKSHSVVEALLTCPTLEKASVECGLSKKSLQNWLKKPSFQAELAEAKKQMMAATINRLQKVAFDAVNVLVEISSDPSASDGARVQASVKLIELAQKAHLQETLEARVANLERQTICEQSSGPVIESYGDGAESIESENDEMEAA